MKKNNLSESEKRSLINKFREEVAGYIPDYGKIATTNQFPDKYSDSDMDEKKRDDFSKAMKSIRKFVGLTQSEMGERLDCSKQKISKIEKNDFIIIPDGGALERIAELFSVSVAYLLGLVDDSACEPSKEEYYFWEHPGCIYESIKEDVISERLINPIATFGPGKKELLDYTMGELSQDYELLEAVAAILKAKGLKRKKAVENIKSLKKILET